jgi:hypothetical protein
VTAIDPLAVNVPPSDPDVLIVAPVRGRGVGARSCVVSRGASPGAGESPPEAQPSGAASAPKNNHDQVP